MDYDVIVVGGGASGLLASVTAAECGDKVLLLEAADRIGRKIAASGNGRCNLMNRKNAIYYGDTDFAKAIMSHMGAKKQTEFWIEHGLFLKEDEYGRTYPTSDLSSSVLDIIKIHLKKNDVAIHCGERVNKISGNKQNGFTVTSNNGSYKGKRIIVSCGGKASKSLGGCDDGYQFMTGFGHAVTDLRPALTQIRTDPVSISGLKGIRQNGVEVSVSRNGNLIHREYGEILFTEYGISGICVMQCSRFTEKGDIISLNFLPGLGLKSNEECLYELKKRQKLFGFLKPQDLLTGWVSTKLSYGILKKAGIDMKADSIIRFSDKELKKAVQAISDYQLTVTGLNGFESAQVTAGGIECRFIKDGNLESEIFPGIHCTGETLNVDGDCGGYNLMFAFATGILAGRNGRGI